MSVTDDAAALKEVAAAISRDGHAATQNVTAVAADHLMVVREPPANSQLLPDWEFVPRPPRLLPTSMGHIDNLIDVMAQILEAVANQLLRGGTT